MKLGEALALRADVQKRMHRMQALLVENATVQEGDTPPVQPVELLEELSRLHEEHERLVRRINRTNAGAVIALEDERLTLADAVVRRDRLAREAAMLRDLASHATPTRNRFLRTELKHVATLDVGDLHARADRLSRAHRELDTRMQQANWEVDVVER